MRLYDSRDVDWLAVYCPELDECFYIPSSVFAGKKELQLRVRPTKNNQTVNVTWASEFTEI